MPRRLRRLGALILKESREIWRDPSSMLVGILLPLILILLFGYGLSLDIQNVSLAVVIDSPSQMADEFRSGFVLSRYFDVIDIRDINSAARALERGRIDAILHLQADFTRRLTQGGTSGPAAVQIILDGTDPNKARIILGYVQGVVTTISGRLKAEGYSFGSVIPIDLRDRIWFNPARDSRYFLVPGLTAIIMTLTGALLTALVVAREWERATFESLFATPVTMGEIIVAKTIPYFGLGCIGFLSCIVSARLLFHIPFHGSWLVLGLGSSLYLLIALGIGLLISSLTRNQFLATQITVIISFLPALMLSGFLFDLRSLPPVIEIVTLLIPARHYITLVQAEFLSGTIRQIAGPSLAVLALMTIVIFAAIRWANRKRVG